MVDHLHGLKVDQVEDLHAESDRDIQVVVHVVAVGVIAVHMASVEYMASCHTRPWTVMVLVAACDLLSATVHVVGSQSIQSLLEDNCYLLNQLRSHKWIVHDCGEELTLWATLVTFLLPSSTCHTSSLGAVTEIAFSFLWISLGIGISTIIIIWRI